MLKKFFNVGFEAIKVVERQACGLADISRYPLFAPDFISFLERSIPSHRHAKLAFSIVVMAGKPA